MANYETLKSAIQQVVKTNGNNEITGALLQQSLLAMINSLGQGYQFVGIANPTTDPGTPDAKVFYLAGQNGTYTYFSGLSLNDGEIAILAFDIQWHKLSTNIVSKQMLDMAISGIEPIVNNGIINNAPDEEDITTVNSLLKLKDRTPINNMGYVILRKNQTVAAQITTSNTIYEIRYDFDLGTAQIDMPANCVLKFNGGKFVGGSIVGNNTTVDCPVVNCFSASTVLSGTWKANIAHSTWFSFINDCVLDDDYKYVSGTDNGQALRNLLLFSNVIFEKGNYYVNGHFYLTSGQTIDGSGAILKCKYTNIYTAAFRANQINHLCISNITMIGWKQETTETTEFTHGLSISGSENVVVKNCSFLYFRGDGVNVSYSNGVISRNIILSNIVSRYNHRQGLSIIGVDLMLVENSEFSYTSGTNPQRGIDIEPNTNEICTNIVLNNIKCIENYGGGISINGTRGTVENVTLKHYYFEGHTTNEGSSPGLNFLRCSNIIIDGYVLKPTFGYGVVFDNAAYENIRLLNGIVIGNLQNQGSAFFWSSSVQSKNIEIRGFEGFGFTKYGFQISNTAKIDGLIMHDIFVHNCYHNIFVFGDNIINVNVQNVRDANVGKAIDGSTYPGWTFGWTRHIACTPTTLIDLDCTTSGTTEQRPTRGASSADYKGLQYFDTTLGKPIWYTGSKWVDATGADA